MSDPLYDRLPPEKNPTLNAEISRPEALADLMRMFSAGFDFGRAGYTPGFAEKICSAFAHDVGCPEWSVWAKAGYVYGRRRLDDGSNAYSRNSGVEDWFKYRETGDCQLKHDMDFITQSQKD